MSSQKLKMTYHPAKKEVLFERFGAEGTPVTIRSDSKLYKYMNKKGQFILQDHGDAFFEDIAKAFDGESSVDMEVVTTKSDFGDFEQMVEYYNEGHNVKINATLLAELPDMNTTYTKVKEHGEKAIAILKKHREDFHTIQTDTPAVKESIDSFSQEVYKASALIREKIDCMGDNNINLCFAGVYSTGKSTLINAILGYRILPEAIHSETARMFEIKSPQKGEPVKISTSINKTHSVNLGMSARAEGTGAHIGYGYSKSIGKTISSNDAQSKGITQGLSLGTSDSTTYTYKSYVVNDLIKKLEKTIERIQVSQANGLWCSASYVLARDAKTSNLFL